MADDLAVVRSCYHESFIHGPALALLHSGSLLLGHPSVGSWVVSGLGSASDNLPAFVVMSDPLDRGLPKGHASNWGAGFIPSVVTCFARYSVCSSRTAESWRFQPGVLLPG